MRVERSFGEPGLSDDLIDGDTLYRAQRKKGPCRCDERRTRTRPFLLPDLGASCEVNLGHAACI